ncbi:MAG: hypothetical protein KGL39_44390 [Patescibacteria group bacterium]|nr:hypothetical protein [Patescibacteria group bacterium]
MTVVNLRLASHPINWAIVFLMLILAGAAGSLLLALLGKQYAEAAANPATTKKVVAIDTAVAAGS